MARARKGSKVQSKINMLLWGAQGTGKSTLALQSAYLKRSDGKPFRVLYIDPESGSIDDYLPGLEANGVNLDNIYIVYSQSLEEVRQLIKTASNGEPFYYLDDEGNETEEIVLDADGRQFNPDMIVVDGTTILYMTSQQGLINFSKKRAAVRANKKELMGDERLVSVELAGMEQKDWGTLKFRGQDLVLDLTACGKHYIITAREKPETKTVQGRDGNSMSVHTGKMIPDSYSGAAYNVKTELHLFREDDDPETVKAAVSKDRCGVYRAGEVIEDPSLLDFQKVIDSTAANASHAVRNNLDESSRIEEKLYTKSVEQFIEQPEASAQNSESPSVEALIATLNERKKALSVPDKQKVKAALEAEGLPINFKMVKDIETAKLIAGVFDKICNG